jgi:hypothetical protein
VGYIISPRRGETKRGALQREKRGRVVLENLAPLPLSL